MHVALKRFLAGTLCGLWLAGSALASGASPSWKREWRVVAAHCPACDQAQRRELDRLAGSRVVVGERDFRNPLYEDCLSTVDYADIKPVSRAEALQLLGLRRLPALKDGALSAGSIRCGHPERPPNVIARVVFGEGRMLLLHESGGVLELR